MNVRTKKLVGTVATAAFLIVYAFVAMRIGVAILPPEHGLWQLVYYAFAGLVWVIPVGALISWMGRE